MSEPIPLTSRQTRALDRIARCPSCGAWVMWANGGDWLTAELDPSALDGLSADARSLRFAHLVRAELDRRKRRTAKPPACAPWCAARRGTL